MPRGAARREVRTRPGARDRAAPDRARRARERGAARQQVAAVRRAVVAAGNGRGDARATPSSAPRHAAAERFAQRDEIRLPGRASDRTELSRLPDPTALRRNQQGAPCAAPPRRSRDRLGGIGRTPPSP
jgi:hypothetical protein